jgi:hypothetical protein
MQPPGLSTHKKKVGIAAEVRKLPIPNAASGNQEVPEKRAGRGLLDFFGTEIQGLLSSCGSFSVALRAMLLEKPSPCCRGIRVAFKWVVPQVRYQRSLRPDCFSISK